MPNLSSHLDLGLRTCHGPTASAVAINENWCFGSIGWVTVPAAAPFRKRNDKSSHCPRAIRVLNFIDDDISQEIAHKASVSSGADHDRSRASPCAVHPHFVSKSGNRNNVTDVSQRRYGRHSLRQSSGAEGPVHCVHTPRRAGSLRRQWLHRQSHLQRRRDFRRIGSIGPSIPSCLRLGTQSDCDCRRAYGFSQTTDTFFNSVQPTLFPQLVLFAGLVSFVGTRVLSDSLNIEDYFTSCALCGSNMCFCHFNLWREHHGQGLAGEWWQCDTDLSFPGCSRLLGCTLSANSLSPVDSDNRFASQVCFLALVTSVSCLLSPQMRHFEHARMGQRGSQLCSWDRKEASPIYQNGNWNGELRRVRNFGRRTMNRHRCLPKSPPPARISVCLQRPPAAAATYQRRNLHTNRQVRLENSRQVRSGSAACCQDYESGSRDSGPNLVHAYF